MTLTFNQELLVDEIRRISVNTRYPQFFTLNINTFLLELVALRKNNSN